MLKGKIAVVTGGSRGIGAAVAVRLAGLGADIAVIYAGNADKAQEVCENCRALGVRAESYRCNVADFQECKDTVAAIKEHFGTIHILVNNAGITKDKLTPMMREGDFDDVIDTNLKGAFNMIRHCSTLFIRNNYGRIVNISSYAGVHGNAGQANYAASKAGIIGLTKSVARELASKGVTANAIAPGLILTDMTKELPEDIVKAVPLGHAGMPEDVSDAVAFLVLADYITGVVLPVDGGLGA